VNSVWDYRLEILLQTIFVDYKLRGIHQYDDYKVGFIRDKVLHRPSDDGLTIMNQVLGPM
jgi:hypothetical protein